MDSAMDLPESLVKVDPKGVLLRIDNGKYFPNNHGELHFSKPSQQSKSHRPYYTRIRLDKHYGFTLVELLVVMTILSILMSLLLPILHTARDSARAIACASQERQIAVGFSFYMEDWRQTLPPHWITLNPVTGWGKAWHIRLREQYELPRELFWCSEKKSINHLYDTADYGLNYNASGITTWWDRLTVGRINHPSRMYWLGEKDMYMLNPYGWIPSNGHCFGIGKPNLHDKWSEMGWPHHKETRLNILFLDSHVEQVCGPEAVAARQNDKLPWFNATKQ